MATLTLTYGATIITLSPPDYPAVLRPTRPQISNMTLGGRILTSNLRTSGTLYYPPFSWPRMPSAEYTSLYSFIDTTVNRRQLAFQMTLWDATVISAIHYWSGIDDAQLIRPANVYALTLEFREVPA